MIRLFCFLSVYYIGNSGDGKDRWVLEFTEIITAFPNLAFGFACLYYAFQVQKERVAAQDRYDVSLEAINNLYMQLLEKAITAIATNASQSSDNGDSLSRLHQELAVIRNDIGGVRELLNRIARDSGKRSTGDRGGARAGAS